MRVPCVRANWRVTYFVPNQIVFDFESKARRIRSLIIGGGMRSEKKSIAVHLWASKILDRIDAIALQLLLSTYTVGELLNDYCPPLLQNIKGCSNHSTAFDGFASNYQLRTKVLRCRTSVVTIFFSACQLFHPSAKLSCSCDWVWSHSDALNSDEVFVVLWPHACHLAVRLFFDKILVILSK